MSGLRIDVARAVLLAMCGLVGVQRASAQVADSGFNPAADQSVVAAAIQGDGKLLVAGKFSQVAAQPYQRIARLLVNGKADPGFAPILVDGDVNAVVVRRDGKILIAGDFSHVGSQPRNRVARLNADGSLDGSFDAGAGPNASVSALAVQADNRVLLGGAFDAVQGVARSRFARLTANGALDTGFDPGTGADGEVLALVVHADGHVVLGGNFTTVDGVARNRVARVTSSGALDLGFEPGSGANGVVRALVAQADGGTLLGGAFTVVDGAARNGVAQLSASGSVDPAFDPGAAANAEVVSLAVRPDGRVLVGGQFTTFGGVARGRVARLHADGALDAEFDPGTGANGTVVALAVQADGRAVLVGDFTSINGVERKFIARLAVDGSVDTALPALAGASNVVWTFAVLPDGGTLVGGWFSTFDGVTRRRIVRLLPNGSLDPGFNTGTGPNDGVRAIVVLPDGRLLIAGDFTAFNGTARNRIARLNANGSLDTSFDPGSGADKEVFAIAVQADGRILLGGYFENFNNVAMPYFARLNADGSLDTGFAPSGGPNEGVYTIIVQADGRLLLGGGFTAIGGIARNRIARLHADGSLDASFDPPGGPGALVNALVLQPDGRMLLSGGFTTVNGTARAGIARLNADGSLDTSFDPGVGVGSSLVFNYVQSLALQADGRVLLGGEFTSVGGVARQRFARLNSNGSLDASFDPGSGANGWVRALALHADGRAWLGGEFTLINGVAHNRINRLSATDAALDVLKLDGHQVRWMRSGSAPELAAPPTLATSLTGAPDSFVPLGSMSRIEGGWQFTVPATVGQAFFVRAEGITTSGYANESSGRLRSTARLRLADRIFADSFE